MVAKMVGGRWYIYFKHGRRWCYIGPMDRVDLGELLAHGYHHATTKTPAMAWQGLVAGMGVSAPALATLMLLVSAYVLAVAVAPLNPRLEGLPLLLISLSAVTFAYTIARYEQRLPPNKRYAWLRRLAARGFRVYLLASVGILWLVYLTGVVLLHSPPQLTVDAGYECPSPAPSTATVSPASPVVAEVETYARCIVEVRISTSIAAILVAGMAVALLARPLEGRARLTLQLLAPLLASLMLYVVPPLLFHLAVDGPVALGMAPWLLGYSVVVSLLTSVAAAGIGLAAGLLGAVTRLG